MNLQPASALFAIFLALSACAGSARSPASAEPVSPLEGVEWQFKAKDEGGRGSKPGFLRLKLENCAANAGGAACDASYETRHSRGSFRAQVKNDAGEYWVSGAASGAGSWPLEFNIRLASSDGVHWQAGGQVSGGARQKNGNPEIREELSF